ncbi:MAG TPA: outer membrane beta-barrel protein [Pyrinomonadaceae bacterium]
MRRSLLLAAIFTAAILVSGSRGARAQTDAGGWEAGGQLYDFDATNGTATVSRVAPCQLPPCPVVTTTVEQRRHEPGFGARLGYGFNRYVTAEAEVNYFPRGRGLTDPDFTGGRKLQGLFGVKAGRRYESFGLFAKARPGFVNFSGGDLEQRPNAGCIAIFPPPLACFESRGRTDFALDVGGVVELYPSARTVVRFDAGDTILFTGAHRVPVTRGLSYDAAVPVAGETTHNFQGGVGFGFRF